MSEANPAPEHHHEDAIEHLEEEIRSLEGVTRYGRPIRIGVFVVILVAAIATIAWWLASPPPITSSRTSYFAATASPIEVVEPRGATLDAPPARFAWESVSGRLQYIVRVYVKGTNAPVLERMVTSSSVELTPEEQALMPRGKTFDWTVAAQGKDGSTIAAGRATFKVR